jgi:hypothetical protein
LRLWASALTIALTGAAIAADVPILGWSLQADGTYVHGMTGVQCPKQWAWVKRFEVSSKEDGPVVGRCRYMGGGDSGELRIRHFDPAAARDQRTLERERQLMNQPGDNSVSPYGYVTRWDEPVIGGKPIPVERYTMKHAGMLIDCETRHSGPDRGDVILDFYGLCRRMQKP